MSDWDNQVLDIDNDLQYTIENLERVIDEIPRIVCEEDGNSIDPNFKSMVEKLETALKLVQEAHATWKPIAKSSREILDDWADRAEAQSY